jgi:hypothetical protein
MTIVGSKRMIVYDDVAPLEKIRIFDARVESPPHYDTFAEFQYAYHYGDMYVPYVKQEEPLKTECQHFLDCIKNGTPPLTDGKQGLELVRILEASTRSLEKGGAPVGLAGERKEDHRLKVARVPALGAEFPVLMAGKEAKKRPSQNGQKLRIKLRVNGQ